MQEKPTRAVHCQTFFHHLIKYLTSPDKRLIHRHQISCIHYQQLKSSEHLKRDSPRFWLYLSINLTILGRNAIHERYNSYKHVRDLPTTLSIPHLNLLIISQIIFCRIKRPQHIQQLFNIHGLRKHRSFLLHLPAQLCSSWLRHRFLSVISDNREHRKEAIRTT